jgi:transcriptional regulator GlxA family with amidase domain
MRAGSNCCVRRDRRQKMRVLNRPMPESLSKILEVMADQYPDHDLSFAAAAKAIHVSERHLRRLFETYTGTNFRVYLRRMRARAAETLLVTTAYDIKTIAWKVGYKDASHFSRDFRKIVGCTPSGYRSNATHLEKSA